MGLIITTLAPLPRAEAQTDPPGAQTRPGVASTRTPAGSRITGRLEGDAEKGFVLIPAAGGDPLPLEQLHQVEFAREPGQPAGSSPPFHVLVGPSDRLSGRLDRITSSQVFLAEGPGGRPLAIQRAGARAVVQSPGQAIVLVESFDNLDATPWKTSGKFELRESPRRAGNLGLRLPSSGSSLVLDLDQPVSSGRLEIAFYDEAQQVDGTRFLLELRFQSATGPASIQVVPGWESPFLAVRSRGAAPALAIQRLERHEGWHQLVVRFGPNRTAVSIDGNELAFGDGPGGTLTGLALVAEAPGRASEAVATAVFDDLRLSRFAEPLGPLEREVRQDELRLVSGDQIFGTLLEADARAAVVDLLGSRVQLSWQEVGGIYFARSTTPSPALEGLWGRLRWHAGGSDQAAPPDSAEGILLSFDDQSAQLQTPYSDPLWIPASALIALDVLGQHKRQVLDPCSHHLGSSPSATLDPPQPEGGLYELTFKFDGTITGKPELAFDLVELIGISGDLNFSERVKRGELVTHVSLNGQRFDQLNRHVTARNDTPTRIRVPIPEGLLRMGTNVLRLEQVGTQEDPARLDNFGLSCVALELTPNPVREGAPAP